MKANDGKVESDERGKSVKKKDGRKKGEMGVWVDGKHFKKKQKSKGRQKVTI